MFLYYTIHVGRRRALSPRVRFLYHSAATNGHIRYVCIVYIAVIVYKEVYIAFMNYLKSRISAVFYTRLSTHITLNLLMMLSYILCITCHISYTTGNSGDIFVGGTFESRVWDGRHFVRILHVAHFDS